jgi:spoIIIJ-associated protein
VEGYKQRRSEALQALAVRMAEQVRLKGVPFTLEPMPAYERRIIHMALTDHPDVTTESTGEGDARKVVILPDQE